MTDKAHIIEVFSSIQGEGPFVGYKQVFIRFSGCNLNCSYCDTEFTKGEESKFYSPDELAEKINDYKNCHSVSLTGGEPLFHTEFLKTFLPKCKFSIYLETNGTLYSELQEVIKYVDYISADIKLPSCTNLKPLWKEHESFFEIAKQKYLFAKIVFDEHITEDEIKKCCELGKKYNIELILQPKMNGDVLEIKNSFIEKIYNKFLNQYGSVRVIPQTHKFLSLR